MDGGGAEVVTLYSLLYSYIDDKLHAGTLSGSDEVATHLPHSNHAQMTIREYTLRITIRGYTFEQR